MVSLLARLTVRPAPLLARGRGCTDAPDAIWGTQAGLDVASGLKSIPPAPRSCVGLTNPNPLAKLREIPPEVEFQDQAAAEAASQLRGSDPLPFLASQDAATHGLSTLRPLPGRQPALLTPNPSASCPEMSLSRANSSPQHTPCTPNPAPGAFSAVSIPPGSSPFKSQANPPVPRSPSLSAGWQRAAAASMRRALLHAMALVLNADEKFLVQPQALIFK